MNSTALAKYLELAGCVATDEQRKLIETARYQAFVNQANSGHMVLWSIFSVLIAFLITVIPPLMLKLPFWGGTAFQVIGFLVGGWLVRWRYLAIIKTQLRRLLANADQAAAAS